MVYSFLKERGTSLGQQKEKRIFFGVLYFGPSSEIQSIFRGHHFLTVPYLAVSAIDMKREAKLETFFQEEDKWFISATEVFDAQK